MYRGIAIVLICFFVFGINPQEVDAQDTMALQDTFTQQSPWGLSLEKLFMDYRGLEEGSVIDYSNWTGGFELGPNYTINDLFSLYAPVKAGVIDLVETEENAVRLGLDVQLHYHFLTDNVTAHPYLLTGIGITTELPGETYPAVPVGLGVGIEMFEYTDFNAQLEYRTAFADEERNNVQFAVGFTHFFNRPPEKEKEEVIEEEEVTDSDEDGIEDELDLCPQKAGPEKFNGCPDSDEDGIADYKDDCPDIAGLEKFNGCPDSDEDGIPDPDDECPNEPGVKSENGCPDMDSDGDGLPDAVDDCPEEAGPESTDGCPDTDGDGVPDKDDKCPDKQGLIRFDGCLDADGDGLADYEDKCPNSPGPEANNGCPELEEEEKELLELASQAVQFDLGESTIKRSSFDILDRIADLMQKYPDYLLRISGHTDNIGTEGANQKLSEQRARSCYEYLHAKGVSLNRMSYVGHGESRPIKDNSTAEGRSHNRRVVFDLYLD